MRVKSDDTVDKKETKGRILKIRRTSPKGNYRDDGEELVVEHYVLKDSVEIASLDPRVGWMIASPATCDEFYKLPIESSSPILATFDYGQCRAWTLHVVAPDITVSVIDRTGSNWTIHSCCRWGHL